MINKGKFIVFEGCEGAGKSSALRVAEQVLQEREIEFINTREPGGTPLAEALRDIVKSIEHDEILTEETELFLMYASRSQLVTNRILPALNSGKWTIGDRHELSARAYQGGGRGFDDGIMNTISDITLKGFKPDLTLYLDVSPTVGLSRAGARGALDRIEHEKIDFFERVRNKYVELAAADENIVTINAEQEMEDVHNDVREQMEKFCDRVLGK